MRSTARLFLKLGDALATPGMCFHISIQITNTLLNQQYLCIGHGVQAKTKKLRALSQEDKKINITTNES
jgi:hypothetical protein